MYIERENYFNGLKIKMRLDPDGRFADVRADENFYKAQGLTGSKEMVYRLGGTAEQVRHPEKVLPRWIRYKADGQFVESPFTD